MTGSDRRILPETRADDRSLDSRGAQPAQDVEWRLRARCRGLSPEVFFVADGERGAARARSEEAAKSLCRSCPVNRQCLDFAMVSGESHGIWGGATAAERRRMCGNRSRDDRHASGRARASSRSSCLPNRGQRA